MIHEENAKRYAEQQTRIAELITENARLRAALRRVQAALNYVEPEPRLDEAILADSHLSLRECARKHGVGVGVVRGVRARNLMEKRHDR